MTVGEQISEIRNELKMVNADYKISNRFIWSIVNKHLRWMIPREFNKLNLLRYDTLFQTLKCVEVAEAPAIDNCCGVKNACTVFRTKEKLPAMFEGPSGVIIKSVFTIDGGEDFSRINVPQYLRKLERADSKFDKDRYCYYNSGYLYFPKSKIRSVMIKAYFEEDISYLNICDDEDIDHCKSRLDEDARIPDGIRGELLKFVLADLAPTRQIRNDDQIDKNENNIR